MQALGLGAAGDRVLYDAARECTGRFRVSLNVDADGSVYMKGATDTRGYRACGQDGCRKKYPCRAHGPHGHPKKRKGRTIDPVAAAWGFTKRDTADVRSSLRALGIARTSEQVFALLLQARYVLDGGKISRAIPKTPMQRKAYEREKKRRRRIALRGRGLCVVCGVLPTVWIEDPSAPDGGHAGSTCYACGRQANQRTRRRNPRDKSQAA